MENTAVEIMDGMDENCQSRMSQGIVVGDGGMAVVGEMPMTEGEKNRYDKLKGVVGKCLDASQAAEYFLARALEEISRNKLYREEFMTFEEFTREQYNLSRSRVFYLIKWTQVIEEIGYDENVHPVNILENEGVLFEKPVDIPKERQTRPLLRLPKEQWKEAWGRAVEETGGNVTGPAVEKVVYEIIGEKEDRENRKKDGRVSPALSMAFDKFFEVVREEKKHGFVNTDVRKFRGMVKTIIKLLK